MESLWIVFDGDEPTTAHLSLEAAKVAGQWAIQHGQGNGPFSIWTAKLDADPSGPGIPVYKLEDGTDEFVKKG